MRREIKIGLVGCGNVGQGVIKVLHRNARDIQQRVGAKLKLAGICDIKHIPVKNVFTTKKYRQLINKPEIDIIVELIGGYEPARTIILEALRAGKNVVTANKAVLAKYWHEIFSTARRCNKLVYFEASVAGGIPVIQALNEGLAANHIEKISGILNGTTNYILSEMTRSRISFKEALNLARFAGFAEANPTFDINGVDTAHKLAILSSIAWSGWVKLEDIEVTGIRGISENDVYFVKKEFGYVIKLIGSAKFGNGKLDLSVEPCLIPEKAPFASVEREFNAVLFRADSAGDIILYGRGAGQFPAASAVVSDLIFLAKEVANGIAGRLPYVAYDTNKKFRIMHPKDKEACYYLRFTAVDKPGVLSKISGILGKCNVSIASVYQKEPILRSHRGVPILMLTHKTLQGNLMRALKQIDSLPIIVEKTVKLKIEN